MKGKMLISEAMEELVLVGRMREGRTGNQEGSLQQMGFLEDSLGVGGEVDRNREWRGRGIMK